MSLTFEIVKRNYDEGKQFFRAPSIRVLLQRIAELEAQQEMWAKNADEAALTTARLQERVNLMDCDDAANSATTTLAKKLLEDDGVGVFGGEWEGRLQTEWRAMKAQLAEAHALGYPVDLFEVQANEMKERNQ